MYTRSPKLLSKQISKHDYKRLYSFNVVQMQLGENVLDIKNSLVGAREFTEIYIFKNKII